MTTDTTGDVLLKAILANPADMTPRLAYADWLEESGQGEIGEFPEEGEPWDQSKHWWIDVACESRRYEFFGSNERSNSGNECYKSYFQSMFLDKGKVLHRFFSDVYGGRGFFLTLRGVGDKGDFRLKLSASFSEIVSANIKMWVHHGFIDQISIPQTIWLRSFHKIVNYCPINFVQLSDRQPQDWGFERFVWMKKGGLPVDENHMIRDELYDFLDDHKGISTFGWKIYQTLESAQLALSRACLKYATEKANDQS